MDHVRFTNNVAYRNRAMGLTVANWDQGYPHPIHDIDIINNTVYENGWEGYPYGGGIGVEAEEARAITVRNNLVSHNRHGQIFDRVGGPTICIDHNLSDGLLRAPQETIGQHALQGDPKFVAPEQADFHLQPTSPALAAGSPENAPAADFDGRPRPRGTAPTVGAFEGAQERG